MIAGSHRLLLIAVVMTFAVSCNRDAPPTVGKAKDPNAVLPRGTPTPADATDIMRTLSVKGTARQYLLVTPKQLDATPWLILVFHGDGGTATSFHAALPYEKVSGTRAVIAYPAGLRATWDLETLDENQDEAFVADVIDGLTKEFHVDKSHVYATGYSSGGFFINVFACHRPGVLRAIASSAAGAPYNQKEHWPNGYPGCPGQRATAMMALHGTADFGVDLKSGRFSAQYWSYVNGCNMHEQQTTSYEECHSYRDCPAQSPVVYCEVPGLGHWVWDKADEASFSFFQTLDRPK